MKFSHEKENGFFVNFYLIKTVKTSRMDDLTFCTFDVFT